MNQEQLRKRAKELLADKSLKLDMADKQLGHIARAVTRFSKQDLQLAVWTLICLVERRGPDEIVLPHLVKGVVSQTQHGVKGLLVLLEMYRQASEASGSVNAEYYEEQLLQGMEEVVRDYETDRDVKAAPLN